MWRRRLLLWLDSGPTFGSTATATVGTSVMQQLQQQMGQIGLRIDHAQRKRPSWILIASIVKERTE
jgi:hypothetical protein